jgi:hypothetical protein
MKSNHKNFVHLVLYIYILYYILILSNILKNCVFWYIIYHAVYNIMLPIVHEIKYFLNILSFTHTLTHSLNFNWPWNRCILWDIFLIISSHMFRNSLSYHFPNFLNQVILEFLVSRFVYDWFYVTAFRCCKFVIQLC